MFEVRFGDGAGIGVPTRFDEEYLRRLIGCGAVMLKLPPSVRVFVARGPTVHFPPQPDVVAPSASPIPTSDRLRRPETPANPPAGRLSTLRTRPS